MRTIRLVGVAVWAAVLLAGCNTYVNFTISAKSLADDVARVVGPQLNTDAPLDVDCGSDTVDLVEDQTVACELSVEGTDEVHDAVVTIVGVEGNDYSFDVSLVEP